MSGLKVWDVTLKGDGTSSRVVRDGEELTDVTAVHVYQGLSSLPRVHVSFLADEVTLHVEEQDGDE